MNEEQAHNPKGNKGEKLEFRLAEAGSDRANPDRADHTNIRFHQKEKISQDHAVIRQMYRAQSESPSEVISRLSQQIDTVNSKLEGSTGGQEGVRGEIERLEMQLQTWQEIDDLAKEKTSHFEKHFDAQHWVKEIDDEIDEIEESGEMTIENMREIIALRQAGDVLSQKEDAISKAKEKAEQVTTPEQSEAPVEEDIPGVISEPTQSTIQKFTSKFSDWLKSKRVPRTSTKKPSSWLKRFNPAILAFFVGSGEVVKSVDIAPELNTSTLSVDDEIAYPESMQPVVEQTEPGESIQDQTITSPETKQDLEDTIEITKDIQTPWHVAKMLLEKEGNAAGLTKAEITKLTRNLALIQKIDTELVKANNIAVPEWGVEGDTSHKEIESGTSLDVESARTLVKKLIQKT
jgi:hypothetical protein